MHNIVWYRGSQHLYSGERSPIQISITMFNGLCYEFVFIILYDDVNRTLTDEFIIKVIGCHLFRDGVIP